jgi:hypothetical protein
MPKRAAAPSAPSVERLLATNMLVTKLSQTAASRRETSQAFLDSNCASDSSLNHCRKPIDTKECGLNEDNCFKAPSPTYTFPKAHRASTKSFSAVSKPCNPKTPVKTSNPCNPKNTPKQAIALESSSSALLLRGTLRNDGYYIG